MTLSQYMLSSIQKILSRNREYFYKLSDQADRIIVWLVGFSIASIALTISHETDLKAISSKLPILIIIFSSITIIFGISYRIFMFIAQSTENIILLKFEGVVDGYVNPPEITSSRKLTGNETCEDIIRYLKEDFKNELSNFTIDNLNLEQKKVILNSLIEYYNDLEKINNNLLEIQKNEIKNILSTNLGYSEKKLDRIFNPVKPKFRIQKTYWFSLYLSSILFLLTSIIYVTGFIIFLWIYLEKIICS